MGQSSSSRSPMSRNLRRFLISVAVMIGAPLLGLLSTVVALIVAFRGVSKEAPEQKARVLAEGISEAMNATAFGLLISIVALVPAIIFGARAFRESRAKQG